MKPKKRTERQRIAYGGTRSRYFYCTVCDLIFANLEKLNQHQVDKHGVKLTEGKKIAV